MLVAPIVALVSLTVLFSLARHSAKRFEAKKRASGDWDQNGPIHPSKPPENEKVFFSDGNLFSNVFPSGATTDTPLATTDRRARREQNESKAARMDDAASKTYSAGHEPAALAALIPSVIAKLLDGSDPLHEVLRRQYQLATLSKVEVTGPAVYIEFNVPANVPRVTPPNFEGGHVEIRVRQLRDGATCLVFVQHGRLDSLEICTRGELWPDDADVTEIVGVEPLRAPARQHHKQPEG
jgi:hypothetical protein